MAIEKRPVELQKISSNKFWAIQMSNSRHRKWTESEEKNELVFDWQGIEADPKAHISDISIAVTKYYPKY
ncbi:MAG TPA: hypothetical protein PK605_05265 [Ignavibacteria bacterium]|nr:hypothetical protein [Bacteroidota bacterium]HCN38316.1 hypothetical protein [Bacteroidota bacterium]HRF66838.1 hypothetical protein [Ignavibacteria bacterium]HRJ03793.1 hypothetical protein [Ignavibacteria bacterium]